MTTQAGLTPKSDYYRRWAFGLMIFGCVAFAVSVFFYWRVFHGGIISYDSEKWGDFGACVSGLAGSLIALATLVALGFTLSLQARELELTRKLLTAQGRQQQREAYEATFFRLLTN